MDDKVAEQLANVTADIKVAITKCTAWEDEQAAIRAAKGKG